MEPKSCRGCGLTFGGKTDHFADKAREVGERKFEFADTEGRCETLIEAQMLLRFLSARIAGWCSPACRTTTARAQLNQEVVHGR